MTSLAEFIQQRREKAGYSIYGLADRASIAVEVLEDIESGRELFLPVTIRQKLARALKCSPNEIKMNLSMVHQTRSGTSSDILSPPHLFAPIQ